MSFLNPNILYLLVLSAIPPIIHLISRRKKEVLRFSSLKFLKELEDSRIKKLKLKQLLLLLIRILIILFLVLGFAKPTLKGNLSSVVGEEKSTTAFIYLDNSLSTNAYYKGKKVFRILKKSAESMLPIISKYDDFYLCYLDNFDGSLKIEPMKETEYNSFLINRIEESQFDGNIEETLKKISENIKTSNNPNKEIFLFTDLQRGEFGRLKTTNLKNTQIFIVSPENEINNNGIQSVNIENQIFEKGKDVNIRTQIGMFSENSNGEVLLSLFINGKRVAQKNVKPENDNTITENFKINIEETGYIKGYFELEDDVLEEDNRRYFSINIPENIKVLVVNEKEKNPYLDAVILSNNNINAENVSIKEYRTINVFNYDVVILNNLSFTSGISMARLKNFLKKEGSLVVIAGNNTDISGYNFSLAYFFDIPRISKPLDFNRENNEFVTFSNFDFTHPILKNITKNHKFTLPKFYRTHLLDPLGKGKTIISFSNGSPFLHESEYSGHKIIVLAGGFNNIESDFVFSSIFAPLVYRIILYAGTEFESTEKDKITGEELNFAFTDIRDEFVIKYPSGESVITTPKSSNDEFFINFTPPVTGFYEITTERNFKKNFFVNFSESESDLRKIPENRLKNIFDEKHLYLLKTDDNVIKNVEKVRYGSEISSLMFIFAFVLIISELILEGEKP